MNQYCSRDEFFHQDDILKEVFPDLNPTKVDDFRYLDLNHRHIAVVLGIGRHCPFFEELLSNQNVALFLDHIKNDLILDLSGGEIHVFDREKKAVDFPFEKEIRETERKCLLYGGSLDQEGNHIIDLDAPDVGPHFGVNLLLGNRNGFKRPLLTTPKSVVNQYGGGSFRAYAAYQVLATTWGLSPEENGHPANRQFYIVEENRPLFYSAHPKGDYHMITTHHPNYTEITYHRDRDLDITRTIFLLPQFRNGPEAVEVQLISIRNLSKKKRTLHLVATGMFGCPEPNAQMVDVIYTTLVSQSRVYPDKHNRIKALTPDYYPEYFKREIRFVSLQDSEGGADCFTTDYARFIGKGSLSHPEEVASLDNSLALKGPNFFALGKTIILEPKREHSLYTLTGYADERGTTGNDHIQGFQKKLDVLLSKVSSANKVRSELRKIIKEEKDYASFLQIDECDDDDFKAYVNHNLPFQVRYQTFVSRSFAQTQKGYREIGFREIQDLYASMPYLISQGKKNLVKELLLEWVGNVYEMGYANHNFYFVGKEPGMCSDDSLWLVDAIYRYFVLTKDREFLQKEVTMAGSRKKRSIMETIWKILEYSGEISVGKHGLPLLDSADWNDCLKLDPDYLNGPEKEKEYQKQKKEGILENGIHLKNNFSESVMNAFLYIIAAEEARQLFLSIGEPEKADVFHWKAMGMTEAVQKSAYIHHYFARVLLNRDNPIHTTYVGSYQDKLSLDKDIDGSFYLNSFSWSLLSDVASPKQIAEMLNVVEKYLRCPAGYKLCTPENLSLAGAKGSSTDHYFPGDRENGGVFKHATMMFVVGLLKQSKKVRNPALQERLLENAFYMMDLVLPYHVLRDVYKYKGNPRFCTQYNNSITEENIGPMLSGTATWLTLAIEEMLGVSFTIDGLVIQPMLPKDIENVSYSLRLKEGTLHISIHKKKGELCVPAHRVLTMDGKKMEGPLQISILKGEHQIDVHYIEE